MTERREGEAAKIDKQQSVAKARTSNKLIVCEVEVTLFRLTTIGAGRPKENNKSKLRDQTGQ